MFHWVEHMGRMIDESHATALCTQADYAVLQTCMFEHKAESQLSPLTAGWGSKDSAGCAAYHCLHAICNRCADEWWDMQEANHGPVAPDQWFQCSTCRSLMGVMAMYGIHVLALQEIKDQL
ncbi:hypothetical protein L226DRAFT_576994 [Lentinus tigrinus ALCF2SS1-7]|uniref:uncharacterized protein n=1 Tax=Lentinus tigrinus ALCF2SS1-7 TaxID=1328758 RepID=UPI00116635BF|nr:hypothetical protein L226DRAFT_576994 [Lentinus tigrinus ALCF2SS1-7]